MSRHDVAVPLRSDVSISGGQPTRLGDLALRGAYLHDRARDSGADQPPRFANGGIDIRVGDYSEILVLRAESDPQSNGGLTAFRLNAENAVNLAVATRMEIRPNDVVFVAEQPVTSWNRALSQILPQIFLNLARDAIPTGGF